MKKLIPILLVLVLILILLPTPEAKADYNYGDTCPSCGKEKGVAFGYREDGHWPYCPFCKWNVSADIVPVEAHYGGTPTCTKGPQCSKCYYFYDNKS